MRESERWLLVVFMVILKSIPVAHGQQAQGEVTVTAPALIHTLESSITR